MSRSRSPGPSSPESLEVEDDYSSNHTAAAQWQAQQDQQSPNGTNSPTTQQPRPTPPIQKRRRVTRACDECRRKKIKCDGKQPCTHCTVYSYGTYSIFFWSTDASRSRIDAVPECTYDQPSNRKRNPAPQYIEALEIRLQRAEALLRSYSPHIDLNDPNLDHLVQSQQGNGNAEAAGGGIASQTEVKPTHMHDAGTKEAQLRSMIESTGQLDVDEEGHLDFHGGSSGVVFLKRLRQELGGLLGSGGDVRTPFLPRPIPPTARPLDSPKSTYGSPNDAGLPNTMDLPSRQIAHVRCVNALAGACALLRFIHQPTFYAMVDRIYDTPAEEYGNEENRFLPLLYVVLALGCMFSDDSQTPQLGNNGYQASVDQGFKYFRAARQMMDVTECRDLTSLQAILCMILFLQSTSSLGTCYSYLGIALRSALRLGLHRNISTNFNLIERESRRRVFWIIRKMDTYVSAMLGFPRLLSDEDIDQELPIEVDDVFITQDTILSMPEGKISLYAASNAHTRLMDILAKVIKYVYPTKGVEQCARDGPNPSYLISHAKIREVERDLQEWLDRLPMALRPGDRVDEEMVRSQQLLRMAYAHVQMMLYRPFLHYVSSKSNAGKNIDERSYACAAACVSVSRNVVHITTEMKKRGLLIGAYWFTIYTTFFAILSLVFFVLENPDKAGSKEILADANAGRDALKGLARRSFAADRCSNSLGSLFDRLPTKLKRRSTESILPNKKRAASLANSVIAGEARSLPDAIKSSKTGPFDNIQRATTFPTPLNTATSSQQRDAAESPRYSRIAISNRQGQSLQDLMSPADASVAGTPDSSSSSSMQFTYPQQQPPQHQIQQGNQQQSGPQQGQHQQHPLAGDDTIPDLAAMMFPSEDPFAYPNQPMMEFDSRQQKHESMNNFLDGPAGSTANLFLSNGGGGAATAPPPPPSNPYDTLEGQLFGPLPPYIMQNQAHADLNLGAHHDMGNILGVHAPPDLSRHPCFPVNNVALNFDDIFAGSNEDWNSMLAEQSFRQ
ncbi:MAG: hypothetical protein M1818_005565 [Claussenomyces sp. TS43310]|nr:MAG: hypothetical protein M1818_005565 [Claussenomyces sp. TS43310]